LGEAQVSAPLHVTHLTRARWPRRAQFASPAPKIEVAAFDKSKNVDTLTRRYEVVEMSRLFRSSKVRLVAFCDRCARVCDAACRADAIRERALMRALRLGVRV
jgi:hypothetical protein